MTFSNNRQAITTIAQALLVDCICARTDYRDSGAQYLVFETRDTRRNERRLELSADATIESNINIVEPCDEQHQTTFRHASDMCPCFRQQSEKLIGSVVVAVELDGDGITILFNSTDRLILTGDVVDPDAEGWSLYGDVNIGIGQNPGNGVPYGTMPAELHSLLDGKANWEVLDL